MTDKTLIDLLIAGGFAHNEYLLSINHTLEVPHDEDFGYPWNLPSRLMRFPIEAQMRNGELHLGLMHPALAEHPFVKRVADAVAPHEIAPNGAPNDFGYSQAPALWWHAVDLIRTHWRQLLATAHFTSERAIAMAVVYGLDHRGRQSSFDPADARSVLSALGHWEQTVLPARSWPDKIQSLSLVRPPVAVHPDGMAEHWPINNTRAGVSDAIGLAWGRVWGIEAGWFGYTRSGYLNWSKHCIALSEAA